jgi:outer membrane biosynthesis protein TonB
MLTIIESGSRAWALAATESDLHIYSREEAGEWAELLLSEDSEQIDQDGSLILEALYEQHAAAGQDGQGVEPEAEAEEPEAEAEEPVGEDDEPVDEDEEPVDEDEEPEDEEEVPEDEDEVPEDEDEEEEEEKKPRRSRAGTRTKKK